MFCSIVGRVWDDGVGGSTRIVDGSGVDCGRDPDGDAGRDEILPMSLSDDMLLEERGPMIMNCPLPLVLTRLT